MPVVISCCRAGDVAPGVPGSAVGNTGISQCLTSPSLVSHLEKPWSVCPPAGSVDPSPGCRAHSLLSALGRPALASLCVEVGLGGQVILLKVRLGNSAGQLRAPA